jgi:hypothetical protein
MEGSIRSPNYFQEQCLDRRLLAITREIVHARTLAISFFGSLEKLVNLFVSSLCTQSALNLEQKAEEALILVLCATKPASDITCTANWNFWIAASHPVHCILLDISFSATGISFSNTLFLSLRSLLRMGNLRLSPGYPLGPPPPW